MEGEKTELLTFSPLVCPANLYLWLCKRLAHSGCGSDSHYVSHFYYDQLKNDRFSITGISNKVVHIRNTQGRIPALEQQFL